ncbi:TolB family protein [Brevibacillus sp. SYSU BS000544]|uniref:TolB family protein n=1 Tax=Brevibacillus sp. SYSU BS000544 TaxID=3416443 RepID=UPI003CE51AF2
MRDDDQLTTPELEDTTVAQLLSHLKLIRQSVPINQQLKIELKQRLLEQMKQMGQNNTPSSSPRKQSWLRRFLPLGAGIAAVLIALPFFMSDSVSLHKPQKLTIENAREMEQVALSPKGEQVGVVSGNAMLYTYDLEEKTRKRAITLPQTKGKYLAPAWSPNDNQIALVEENGEIARLWLVDFDQKGSQYASRLLWEEKDVQFSGLDWNPVRTQISFTRKKDGKEEAWIANTNTFAAEKLIDGRNVSWSPDGKLVSYEKDGEIQIMNMLTNQRHFIVQGTYPSWVSDNQFTYISNQGELVEAVVDPETLVARSEQNIPVDGMTIQQAKWANDGKHLVLVSSEKQQNTLYIAERNE